MTQKGNCGPSRASGAALDADLIGLDLESRLSPTLRRLLAETKKGRPATRPSLSQRVCLGDYLVAGFFSVTSPFFSVAFLASALTEVAIIFPSFSV